MTVGIADDIAPHALHERPRLQWRRTVPPAMPDEMKTRLHAFLLAELLDKES